MTNQRLAETYLARAQELEDYAQRVEQNPPSIHTSPRWRDTAFLRREAAWWRAHAQAVAEAAWLTTGPSYAAERRG
jgi:hypothetical protein